MKLRPKLLSALIIFSFVFILMFVSEAHRPESVAGFIFWMSFGVFVFSMIHLGKNEKYYKQFLDDEHLDNLCLHQLYEKLDALIKERKDTRQFHRAPEGYTVEEYLQELDEEETSSE